MRNPITQAIELYPRLTKEETIALFEKLEETNCDDTREFIINSNLGLVTYMANRFSNTKVPMDDLVQVGMIGLLKSIDSYSLDKGYLFATYAGKVITNEILMYLRKYKRNKDRELVTVDQPMGHDDAEKITLQDIIKDDVVFEEKFEHSEVMTTILQMIPRLTDRQQFVVNHMLGLNGCRKMTQAELSVEMSLSQSYVSRLWKYAVDNLRELLIDCELLQV